MENESHPTDYAAVGVPHQTVIRTRLIIGGAGVACRCGWGRWYASRDEAEQGAAQHSGRAV